MIHGAQQIVRNAKIVFERELIAREARRYGQEMRLAGTPVTRAQAIAHATSVVTANDVESMLQDYLRAGDKDLFSRRVSLMGGEIPGKAGTSIITVSAGGLRLRSRSFGACRKMRPRTSSTPMCPWRVSSRRRVSRNSF